jgi:hypothetical protein
VALFLVGATAALAASTATLPPTSGLWKAGGAELRGSFTVSADHRYVSNLHGIVLSGARQGCPVVHAGAKLVLPAKLPITHITISDTYAVLGKYAGGSFLQTPVIIGGRRHVGYISINWAPPTQALVSITYSVPNQGCHIQFYAVTKTG